MENFNINIIDESGRKVPATIDQMPEEIRRIAELFPITAETQGVPKDFSEQWKRVELREITLIPNRTEFKNRSQVFDIFYKSDNKPCSDK